MIQGLNHITLAVSNLTHSFKFYTDILGFKPHARWAQGAYLTSVDFWLCLSVDQVTPSRDYTHVAFTIDQKDFEQCAEKLTKAEVTLWKKNTSEGDSIYFLDPDDHKLELHAGNLESRLQSIRHEPYNELVLFD